MKNSSKSFFAILVVPIAVLILSGCGKQTAPQQKNELSTPNPSQQETAAPKADEETSVAQPLKALPDNKKAAIDTEVKNIDKELQAADAAISNDTTDSSLGL